MTDWKSLLRSPAVRVLAGACVGVGGAAVCATVLMGATRLGGTFDPSLFAGGESQAPYIAYDNVTFDARQNGEDGVAVDENAAQEADVQEDESASQPLQLPDGDQTLNLAGPGRNDLSGDTQTPGQSGESTGGEAAGGTVVEDGSGDVTIVVPGSGEGDGQGTGEDGEQPGGAADDPAGGATNINTPHTDADASYVPPTTGRVESSYPTQEADGKTVQFVVVSPHNASKQWVLYPGEQPSAAEMAKYIYVGAMMSGERILRGDLAYACQNDIETFGGDYVIDWDASTPDTMDAAAATVPGMHTAQVYYHGCGQANNGSDACFEYRVMELQLVLNDFDEDFAALGDTAQPQTIHVTGSTQVDLSAARQKMLTLLLQRTESGLAYRHVFRLSENEHGYAAYFGGWATEPGGTSVGGYYYFTKPELDRLSIDESTGIYSYKVTLYPVWVENGAAETYQVALIEEDGVYKTELVDYLGNRAKLETLAVPEGVEAVDLGALAEGGAFPVLKTVSLSSAVSSFTRGSAADYPCLESIAVHADNSCYLDVEGLLYNKTGQRLLLVPPARHAIAAWSCYLDTVARGSFADTSLEAVALPKTAAVLEENSFAGASVGTLSFAGAVLSEGCLAGADIGTLMLTRQTPVTLEPGCFGFGGAARAAVPSVRALCVQSSVGDALYLETAPALVQRLARDGFAAAAVGFAMLDTTDSRGQNYCFAAAGAETVWILSAGGDTVVRVPRDAAETVNDKLVCSLPSTVTEGVNVVSLAADAFVNCGVLDEIRLPETVAMLESGCFAGQTQLQSLYLEGNAAPALADEDAKLFGDTMPQKLLVFVPQTMYDSVLSEWKAALDSAYGEATAQKILIEDGDTLCREDDGSVYEETATGVFTLVRAVCGTDKTFCLKQGTNKIYAYAFFGCADLVEVQGLGAVSEIGDHAFAGCTALQGSLELLNATNIGASAFEGCSALQGSLVFPRVQRIDTSAFRGCAGLTGTLRLPSRMSTVSDYAFAGCTGLEGTLLVPSTVRSIGSHAFERTGFTEICIDAVCQDAMGEAAFGACPNLTAVTISGSIGLLSEKAFERCDSLQTVNITGSVETVGSKAFYYCGSLQSVTVSSIGVIGDWAFCGCSSLTQFTWSSLAATNSLTSIGTSAFYGTALTGLPIDNTTGKPTTAGLVKLTDETIGSYSSCVVFEGYDDLDGSALFSNLSHIGSTAFSYEITLDGGDAATIGYMSIPAGLQDGNGTSWATIVNNSWYNWFGSGVEPWGRAKAAVESGGLSDGGTVDDGGGATRPGPGESTGDGGATRPGPGESTGDSGATRPGPGESTGDSGATRPGPGESTGDSGATRPGPGDSGGEIL